jgi:hypothetical protein
MVDDQMAAIQSLKSENARLRAALGDEKPTDLASAQTVAEAFILRHAENPRVVGWVEQRRHDPGALARLVLAGMDLEGVFGVA